MFLVGNGGNGIHLEGADISLDDSLFEDFCSVDCPRCQLDDSKFPLYYIIRQNQENFPCQAVRQHIGCIISNLFDNSLAEIYVYKASYMILIDCKVRNFIIFIIIWLNVNVVVYSLVSVYILSLDFTFTPWPGFQNFIHTCYLSQFPLGTY